MSRRAKLLLSHGERKGPAAERWEGEGFRPIRPNPSSTHASCGGAGPFFSLREKT
jgi:hypothetical protein